MDLFPIVLESEGRIRWETHGPTNFGSFLGPTKQLDKCEGKRECGPRSSAERREREYRGVSSARWWSMVEFIYDHLPCYEVARNDDGLLDVFEIYKKSKKKTRFVL